MFILFKIVANWYKISVHFYIFHGEGLTEALKFIKILPLDGSMQDFVSVCEANTQNVLI